MDIQDLINAMNQAQKLESAKEYSLGKLIRDLQVLDPHLMVVIDNGCFPEASLVGYSEAGDEKCPEYDDYTCKENRESNSVFYSWRGVYCQLAMQFSDKDTGVTCGDLLEMAKFVNGKYLQGYKGGDYLMDLRTPIHVDNYGESGGLKLIGAALENGKVILKTREEEE